MIRISFAILALVFVQLVNGQDACTTAQINLTNNTACATAFSTGTDSGTDANATVCVGTCRDLFDAIISSCNATIASNYSTFLGTLCSDTGDACTTAQTNLVMNATCLTDDTDAICTGTCRDLFDAIIISCNATTTSSYSTLLKTVCGDTGDACTTAQMNLVTNTACVTAFSTGTDTDAICTGTCRDLFDAIIISCNATTTASYSTIISTLCDGGTDTGCETAAGAINNTCLVYLNGTDTSACSGSCDSQLSTAVAACASSTDTQTQLIISTYNTVCGSGAQCTDALQALNADTSCTTAIEKNDNGTYCSGTCTALLKTVFSACPDSNFISQEQYNQACGNGAGSVLKTSEVITLLLVAIAVCTDF